MLTSLFVEHVFVSDFEVNFIAFFIKFGKRLRGFRMVVVVVHRIHVVSCSQGCGSPLFSGCTLRKLIVVLPSHESMRNEFKVVSNCSECTSLFKTLDLRCQSGFLCTEFSLFALGGIRNVCIYTIGFYKFWMPSILINLSNPFRPIIRFTRFSKLSLRTVNHGFGIAFLECCRVRCSIFIFNTG